MGIAFHHADRRVLRVEGGDRLTWLNGLVTCNLTRVVPGGNAGYGFIVEKKGKIVTDLFVLATESAFFLAMPRERAEETFAILDKHLFSEDVELAFDDDSRVVSFHGAGASTVFPDAYASGAWDPFGAGGVLAVGLAEAFADVSLAPEEAFARFRFDAFLPRIGIDFDGELLPHEASLDAVGVAFDKGCYLGQEVLYMLEHRGKARRRTVVVATSARDAVTLPPGTEVLAGADAVGTLRMPFLDDDGVRAFALVKSAQAVIGHAFTAGGHAFTVVSTEPHWAGAPSHTPA